SLFFGLPLLFSGLSFLCFGLNIFERSKKSDIAIVIFVVTLLGFLLLFSQTLARGFSAIFYIIPLNLIIALIGLVLLSGSIGSIKRITVLFILSVIVTVIFTWFFNSLGCSLKIIQGERDACFENLALN